MLVRKINKAKWISGDTANEPPSVCLSVCLSVWSRLIRFTIASLKQIIKNAIEKNRLNLSNLNEDIQKKIMK
jgi:hypothetical protein